MMPSAQLSLARRVGAFAVALALGACGTVAADERAAERERSGGNTTTEDAAAMGPPRDGGRTREVSTDADLSWATPPVCTPGVPLIDVSVTDSDVVQSSEDGVTQSFVARTSGLLTKVVLAIRRCNALPGDRLLLSVRTDELQAQVVAETSIAYVPVDCTSPPPLDVVFDLSADCGRVTAGRKYRINVGVPQGVTLAPEPRFRVAMSAGDVYAAGERSAWSGNVAQIAAGDLAFRTFVAP